MKRLGRSSGYIRTIKHRIEQLKYDLLWTTLGAIQPDGLSRWLRNRQIGGLSQRAANHYLQAATAFCNWCVSQRRMEKNPVGHIAGVDVTKQIVRRALTLDEIDKLLKVAGSRRTIYQAALLTGLRRNELKLLQWGDIKLGENPRILLRAETTKAGRADVLPIPAQLVADLLAIRPADHTAAARVFRSIPKRETFDSDLTRAGIQKTDDRGWKVDFHSLRKTYGSLLAKSGASLREAMQLMRHTDARLTTQIYTDPRLLDTASAVDRLPRITGTDESESQQNLKTGTYDVPENHVETYIVENLVKSSAICGNSGVLVAKRDADSVKNTLGVKRMESVSGVHYKRHDVPAISHTCECKNMEAAGIEPASRDRSRSASTCIVDRLVLDATPADQQADVLSSATDSSRRAADAAPVASLLSSFAPASRRGRENGLLIRQPCATACWHINLCSMINEAHEHPRHATIPSSCPVEPNSPPEQTIRHPL
ncbi:MAG: Tyrosine recombinase XerC [Phycisphaerae bacterium]|nr:Tyrosine recombinase XerC [Phycisphaerae bacterium]